jgi:hypothetical protein
MPTLKQRISITLEDAEIAVLDRFSSASGTPRASVVADLIRTTLPSLSQAADLMELANSAPLKVKQNLVAELGNATLEAMGALQEHKQETQSIINSIQKELQFTSKRRGSSGARAGVPRLRKGAQDPHLLTGGSKS